VIPLSKIDFVHTRLTHSLEVSVVGRSLGRLVGKKIIEKYPYLKEVHGFHMNDFGAIVAAASLAHDIGNRLLDIQVKSDREYFSIGWKKYQDKLSKSNGRI
jgi:dGTPase